MRTVKGLRMEEARTNARPVAFRSLPLFVRIATMLAWFMAWVLFAELVIDRHGLDAFLPLYRVGDFCPYDLLVLVLLAWSWWRMHRPPAGRAASIAARSTNPSEGGAER
jgi:hypothetical protein